MKKVLITGGAGFIGSNLSIALTKNGWDIWIIDIRKDLKNIEEFVDKVEYISLDIRSPKLEDIIKEINPDGIIHLAAISRVVWCEENPEQCISVNVEGTRNLLNVVSKMKDKPWVIFSSSREVYGNQVKFPVKENCTRKPISIYAKTKCICEDLFRKYDSSGLKAIILRLSNVYGNEKDIPERVIPNFIIKTLSGGEITINGKNKFFDFTFITDTVHAIIKTCKKIENEDNGFIEEYNICTGEPTKLEKVAEIISNILDVPVNITYKNPQCYEVTQFYGDTTKAREHLKFVPEWNIVEGLKYTIRRYKKFIGRF